MVGFQFWYDVENKVACDYGVDLYSSSIEMGSNQTKDE